MDFRTTSTRGIARDARCSGFTLVEMMVGLGLGLLAMVVVALMLLHSGRSFAALTNYADLDQKSRAALDEMTRDVRQANRLISFNATHLVFEDFDGQPLTFAYSPEDKTLARFKSGLGRVLLTGCDTLRFSIFQRNPMGGTYDQYPTADAASCKLINVTWTCSRSILNGRLNTESVQTAKIVIRKQ